MSAGKLTIREVAELSLFCALMVAGKECLRVIPNVHPVTLLLLLATIIYGVKALYPAFGFALLEIALYGAAPEPKRLLLVENGTHNNSMWTGNGEYQQRSMHDGGFGCRRRGWHGGWPASLATDAGSGAVGWPRRAVRSKRPTMRRLMNCHWKLRAGEGTQQPVRRCG